MMRQKGVVLLFILTLLLPSVLGVSIGVSPGRINFNNMLRDGYAELYVTISSNSEDKVIAHYEFEG